MSAPLLVFDLDGTLVDTAPDLIDTLNVVFAREGLPPVPYATARKLIGGGARAMIARGLEAEGRVLNPMQVERLFDDFIAHYAEHIADRSRPFPGLIEALDALAARGHRFAVCTNKLEWLSVLLLRQLDLAGRFAAICGAGHVRHPEARSGHPARHDRGGGRRIRHARSWSGIPKPTSAPRARPAFRSSRSISATPKRPVAEFGPDRVISHFARIAAAPSPQLAHATESKPAQAWLTR